MRVYDPSSAMGLNEMPEDVRAAEVFCHCQTEQVPAIVQWSRTVAGG